MAALASVANAADSTPPAPAQDHWYVVSAGQSDLLEQVIWTGKEFLAVGGDVVMRSTNGRQWMAWHLHTQEKLNGIAYNGQLYAVVGNNGTILTSPDFGNWTTCTAPSTARLSSVFALSGGNFLAAGDHCVLYSQNGSNWNSIDSLNSKLALSSSGTSTAASTYVPAGNLSHGTNLATGQFLLADESCGLWQSTGLVNWTKIATTTGAMADVATDGTRCVAVGEKPNNIYTSPDGNDWKSVHAGTNVTLNGVAYGDGRFEAVGDSGTILTATNTNFWQRETTDTKTTLSSVASNGKIFVAVTNTGAVLARLPEPTFTTASLTLLNQPTAPVAKATATSGPYNFWTVVSKGETTTYWQMAWLGNSFVGVGNAGAIVTSPDGVVWTKQASQTHEHLFDIATNGKIFAAGGDRGALVTSPDLKVWTAQSSGLSERIFTIIWAGTQFVALTANTTATSPDGVTWTPHRPTGDNGFHHGLWTGSQIVATTVNTLNSSTDGIRWTITQRVTDKMFAVATDGSLLVGVGSPLGVLYISTGGQTWTPRPTGAAEGLASMAWTGKYFVGVGGNDTLVTSPEGMNWTVAHTGTGLRLNAVAAHDDTVVIGSYAGEILINKKVDTVAAPEISLAPGAPGSVPQVMLTRATPEATIYYTLDGTEPTPSSLVYNGPFTLAVDTIIKARAFKKDVPASATASAQFTPGK